MDHTCVFWQLNEEDLAGDKTIQNATESAELNRNRMQTNHQFCCRSNYQLCSADYQLCFLNRSFRSTVYPPNSNPFLAGSTVWYTTSLDVTFVSKSHDIGLT